VIADGPLYLAGLRQAQVAELQRPQSERPDDPHQVAVARQARLDEAESDVVPEVVARRAAGHVVFERILPGVQLGDPLRRAVVDDQLADEREEAGPDLVDGPDLAERGVGHVRPAAGRHDDDAVPLKLGQGLAHRGPAGAEPAGQVDGVE